MLMFLRFNKVGKLSAEAVERDYNHSIPGVLRTLANKVFKLVGRDYT